MRLARLLWLVGAPLSMHACDGSSLVGEAREAGASSDAAALPDPAGGPTYTRDVRPILTRACVPCHASGEIAPFALDTYAATVPLMAEVTRSVHRSAMPPAPIDNSGACNLFRDTPRLAESDIATLDAWADRGAPEGDPRIPAPAAPSMPRLQGEVHTISTGVDYAPPATDGDAYRCFVAEAPMASGPYFVTGFDVRPGNRRIVHHLIVHYPRTATAAAAVRDLDAAEAGPGYSCFADARVGATPIAAWAPGYGATRFPDGLGVQLEGGRPVVIEVHYNLANGPGTDRTEVDLEVRTTGVTPGRFVALVNDRLTLPPRQPEVAAAATLRLRDVTEVDAPVHLYGVFPHMHTLATSQHVEVTRRDGSRQCVVDVPRWNFHWQRLYLYQTPLLLDPADDITLTCRYNTLTRTDTVTWGEGTRDEMCVTALFLGP